MSGHAGKSQENVHFGQDVGNVSIFQLQQIKFYSYTKMIVDS